MKVIHAILDYGIWCKKGKYHLVSNALADSMIREKVAVEIAKVDSNDLAYMLADWKHNGMPENIVKYFKK